MLHIRMLSGEELASLPVEEVSDVRELKRLLNRRHGQPPRFRQRLLLHSASFLVVEQVAVNLVEDH